MEIRALSPEELRIVIDWAADEGWNPGLHDAQSFFSADPEGFLGAFIDGQLVGSISAVCYGDDYAFLGLYLVKPELRGQGIGSQLWAVAMQRVGGRRVGLDGVVDMQSAYARSGFALAYRNIRFGGQVSGVRPLSDAMVVIGRDDLHRIQSLDRATFGADRSAFLADWLSQPEGHSWAYVEDDQVRGFGTVRACREGFKVGPLVADSALVAAEIFNALAGSAANGGAIYLDVPEPNAAALDLARAVGLSPVFETARMYTKGNPSLDIPLIFGVTSFELG
jgi:GNAT superfamily N-acetyltransferase